jgi:hypothetical protein
MDSSSNNLEWFSKRKDLMNDVFDELVSVNIYNDYNDKIDTLLVDSLLKAELLDKNNFSDIKNTFG